MAAHETTEYSTADGNDYPAHEQTYQTFTHLVAIGICHILSICIGLAIGGVKGHWWACGAIIVVATIVAIHGLITGVNMPSYVMVALSLLVLALI